MKLEGKCVKVIDSDITEDTCWSKCYSYVITKDIHVLNNVKLSVQDGACVYLLNGKWDWDSFEYKGGGIIFDSGSKLCAGILSVAAVVLEDGKYVITTKLNDNISNKGIRFYGTKEELEEEDELDEEQEPEQESAKLGNLSKSDKAKLYRKKMNDLKKSMVKENNQPSKFVFKSLNFGYLGGLFLVNLDSKEFCGKNINIVNFSGQTYFNISPLFNLDNTNICLDNLEIITNKPKITGSAICVGVNKSTLNVNKSLIVVGGSTFFENTYTTSNHNSYIILNKCSKIILEVAFFNGYESIATIEPKGILPNVIYVPYLVDKCLKEKVVITSKPYY
jgi:hypothetical protein